MSAAPNFAYRLAAAARYGPGLDLSRMRVCISGGERLDWQALLDFHATAAPMGFDWGAIVPSYGLAEGTVAVTYTPLGRGPVRGPGGYVSAGRPMAGVQVEAPAGPELGPIRFRSDWLFSGYHADGALRPVVPGEWFDTGDAGFVHEGELYVSGRRDEVLTTGGRNVFAEDVETVAHDVGGQRIRCCAAFRTQTDSERLALMIEANPRLVKGLEAARELAAEVQGRVATTLGTRLRPVLVVRAGAIPRTSSGKVQRGQCRALYGDGRLAHRLITALG
jgi:fatty-acyl-CoA synthase